MGDGDVRGSAARGASRAPRRGRRPRGRRDSRRRGWDPSAGPIELKCRAGRRKVPIPAVLRDYLIDHQARSRREGPELIFGRTAHDPFTPNRVQARADEAWREAERERLTPHECRHTFASLMIAAGVNAKALSTFMATPTSRSPLTDAGLRGGGRRVTRRLPRRPARAGGGAGAGCRGVTPALHGKRHSVERYCVGDVAGERRDRAVCLRRRGPP